MTSFSQSWLMKPCIESGTWYTWGLPSLMLTPALSFA
eukprot:CAMPEP_0197567380 /NCGR_PEP_ID=MMETSP1320-20131121/35515_1 /TAXON_ID=91990 /ORGANISM="Bolidomonas sp., Strain RCC2347" /LENGTH=36 /DNA_ID= /DNA_START= /DNA_END= /DNA_ORIENTATION=